MATNNRTVDTEQAREMLVKFITGKALPFTCSITDGKARTNDQNRLQRLWMIEIATQLGDRLPENVRGECKLTFGVPLLRRENDAFRLSYDTHIKPLPYATKLALMQEPISVPITSLMTTRQLTSYLDEVHRFYSEQGLILTNPEDLKHRRAA